MGLLQGVTQPRYNRRRGSEERDLQLLLQIAQRIRDEIMVEYLDSNIPQLSLSEEEGRLSSNTQFHDTFYTQQLPPWEEGDLYSTDMPFHEAETADESLSCVTEKDRTWINEKGSDDQHQQVGKEHVVHPVTVGKHQVTVSLSMDRESMLVEIHTPGQKLIRRSISVSAACV